MSAALQLVVLAALAIFGVTQANPYGRIPVTRYPYPYPPLSPYCYQGPDDLSALLLLARAVDRPCDDVNSGAVIDKLVNALVYTTTACGAGGAGGTGGAGGSGGAGGAGGSGGSVIPKPTPRPTPKPTEDREPALIDLGLLTGDDLLNLILAGTDLLRVDLGQGGGAVTKLVNGLI